MHTAEPAVDPGHGRPVTLPPQHFLPERRQQHRRVPEPPVIARWPPCLRRVAPGVPQERAGWPAEPFHVHREDVIAEVDTLFALVVCCLKEALGHHRPARQSFEDLSLGTREPALDVGKFLQVSDQRLVEVWQCSKVLFQ